MAQARSFPALRLGAAALGALFVLTLDVEAPSAAAAPDAGAVARGAYLFAAADCGGCHTDKKAKGPALAGGAAMVTAFGTFYAPNITPHPTAGIGGWTEAQFKRAMREGRGKNGEFLYPVFPYPAFTGMSDRDIADLWAFLKTQPASAQPSKRQQAKAPYNIRPLLAGWRTLYFRPGPLQPTAGKSAEWNRGRYLSEAVVHCQECHTPRNKLGALENSAAYAGEPHGPDNQNAPNLTPHPSGPIATWSEAEIVELLKDGALPDGDYVGSTMATVVEGTGKLNPADLKAIAVYIKSLPPKPSTPK